MAKKSFENTPVEPAKKDQENIQVDPEKKDFKEKQNNGKKKYLKIRIRGSVTIWSQRYAGEHEWAEDDQRLLAAKGEYDLIGEVWK